MFSADDLKNMNPEQMAGAFGGGKPRGGKAPQYSREDYREELISFYKRYGLEDKLDGVDAALDKWKGREEKMMNALYKKYDKEVCARARATAPRAARCSLACGVRARVSAVADSGVVRQGGGRDQRRGRQGGALGRRAAWCSEARPSPSHHGGASAARHRGGCAARHGERPWIDVRTVLTCTVIITWRALCYAQSICARSRRRSTQKITPGSVESVIESPCVRVACGRHDDHR